MKEGEPVLGGPQANPGSTAPSNTFGPQPAGLGSGLPQMPIDNLASQPPAPIYGTSQFSAFSNNSMATSQPNAPTMQPNITTSQPNIPVSQPNTATPFPFSQSQQPSMQPLAQPSAQSISQPMEPQPISNTVASDTGDIMLGSSKPSNSRKKLIIGIVLVILMLTIAVAFIVFFGINGTEGYFEEFSTEVGKPNFGIIYDSNSPIPILKDSLYGYYSPAKQELIIKPQFKEAERFYGNYAKVEQESGNYAIIDRSGKAILEAISADQIYYDVNDNYWAIEDSIYDSSMKKVNPEGTIAKYLGHGYLQIMTEEVPSETYISNYLGEILYTCQGNCNALLTKDIEDSGTIYASIYTSGIGTTIINLSNTQEIYSSKEDAYFLLEDTGIFSEINTGDNGFIEYVILSNGSAQTSLGYEKENITEAVFGNGKYEIVQCDNEKYKIISNKDDQDISACKYEIINILPQYLYDKFSLDGKELVVATVDKDGEYSTAIIDIHNDTPFNNFTNVSLSFLNESPFVLVGDNYKFSICNVLIGMQSCLPLSQLANIRAYDTYVTIDSKIYDFWLREVEV